MDCTVGTTGFVNYFPSAERTARKVEEAYEHYGKDIAIIDGEDDWTADSIFHVDHVLEEAHVRKLFDFHTGVSGIAKSGAVIALSDLPRLLSWVAKHAPKYEKQGKAVRYRLAYYDRPTNEWRTLVQKEWAF